MDKDGLKPTQLNVLVPEKQVPESGSNSLSAVKSRGRPLGGVPEVKIPPLDAEPVEDAEGNPMTMQAQAEILRDPGNPLSPNYDPQTALGDARAVEGAQMDPYALRAIRQGQPLSRKQNPGPFGGTLPPEAQKDPNFRPGVGSMYAANQPAFRQRGEERKILSDETIEGLEALKKFQEETQAEQEKQQTVISEEQAEEEVKRLDDDVLGVFNSPNFMNQYQKETNELNTEELRKAIESRCKPINVEQLIMDGEVRQDVPVLTGKLIVTYRTITGEENLEIERMVFGTTEPDIYVFDKLSMMQLACGLYAVNGQVLPNHLGDNRRFDKDKFKLKFRKVLAMPLVMLASMGINFTWFDQRTRRLFIDMEPLKNG